MELYKIRSGSKEEFEARAYNIGVGISLGNKWFSIENSIELTKWALKHTKDYVVIYIADSIHAINLEVRKKINSEKAREQALELGLSFMNEIKAAVRKEFSPADQRQIHFAHWEDIANNTYKKKVNYLYNLYETDTAFQNTIESVVRNFVSKEERKFKEDEIHKLGTYILEEFPEQITRVSAGEFMYDAFVYPGDSEIVRLAERINKGEIFPEVKENIVDTKPKVFLEVY
jgi:tRNA-dependent cyclodipeptide synthase